MAGAKKFELNKTSGRNQSGSNDDRHATLGFYIAKLKQYSSAVNVFISIIFIINKKGKNYARNITSTIAHKKTVYNSHFCACCGSIYILKLERFQELVWTLRKDFSHFHL